MSVFAILGVSLSVFALSTLVAGDPASILTINSIEVTNNPNDYFDSWTLEIAKGQKSSQLNAKIPMKKDAPENVQVNLVVNMKDQDPLEYSWSLCDALGDMTVGKSFVDAGIPKGAFPKGCPFKAGDWGISKWDPPTNMIPPGIPDGPVTGSVTIMEEGKEPYIIIDYKGDLSHGIPMLGR